MQGHRYTASVCVPRRPYEGGIVKKPTKEESESAAEVGCTDPSWVQKYPTLLEYLTSAVWDDKSPREVSTLSIRIEGGQFQLGLNDKAMKRSVYTTASTLTEALKLLEGCLAHGKEPWRSWKGKK
jgi:hypothetical protein